MQTGLFKRLLTALGNGFGDLTEFFDTSNGNFTEFAAYLGQPNLVLPPAYQALVAQAGTLRSVVTTIANTAEPSYQQLADLVTAVATFVTAIEAAAGNTAANNNANPNLSINWTVFSEQLTGTLVMVGLRRYLPAAYHLLALMGVFTGNGNFYAVGDDIYETRAFNLAHFKALLNQPTAYLTEYFGWGVDFTFDSAMQADLMSLLEVLGTEPVLVNADVYSPPAYDGMTDPTRRGAIFLPFKGIVGNALNKLLSVSLLAESTFAPNTVMVEETDPETGEVTSYPSSGPYDELVLNLLSDASERKPFNVAPNLTLEFFDLRNALRFRIGPNGVNFANGSGLDLPTLSIKRAVALVYAPVSPLILIGEPSKTRLQASSIELALDLSVTQGVRLTLKAVNSQFFIKGSEGDSFIGRILPDSVVPVPLGLSLSTKDGLRFNGDNSLRIVVPKDVRIGPVRFQRLTIVVASTPRQDLILSASANVVATLGPVIVTAVNTGVSFAITELSSPKNIALGFKLPSGIGISVDSATITGGGYLYIDAANHKYAGVATLDIKGTVKVNALGLLQTRLPDNRPGYSFLLLITAEFTPIQLGYGFTLNGLGGLVGINRTANTRYLREQVRTGNIASLLFPRNVLDNPTAALATADNGFPATEGRYVFGLMAKIGWGVPITLISLDLGLIIELPAPVRLLILGSLQAVLPDPNKAILKLRADFLGVIDFGAKTAEFDASLVNSFILTYALTGDLAARLYWGEKPVFLQTAGGFHPAFQPPVNANLPTLRRLTLAFANSSDFKLILYSYFAVTSNTVQFGSRLELFVDLPGSYYLTGFLGFDALFQFNPFRVLTQAGAGLAVKKGNSTKLSLYLSLTISGPAPWHVVGEGSFKILCFKIKFRVDRTFGGSAPAQPLPNVDVRQLLVAALQDRATWAVEAPAVRAVSSVSLRAEADATQLVLEPGGALAFRQQVAPFGVTIERFGQAVPVNGRRFEFSRVTLGTSPIGAASTPLEDQFAPGQFRQLSDAQRLSAPSFQLLRSGARIGGVEGYAGGRSISRDTGYEYYLLSNVGADTAGRPAGGTTPTLPVEEYTSSPFSIQPLNASALQQLGRLGAVSKAKQSHEQRRASRLAPDQVKWDADDYLLIYTADLTPYDNKAYASETEASQALAQLVATNADLANDLQVLPAYHLATLVAL